MVDHIHVVYKKAALASISGNQPDLLYMIKALKKIGKKIHLHCFYPERVQISLIKDDCLEISTYAANSNGINKNNRLHDEIIRLKNNLAADNAPILVHSYPSAVAIKDLITKGKRPILIRLLRDEPAYLSDLAKVTPWGFLKLRYWMESMHARKFFKYLIRHEKIAGSIIPDNRASKLTYIPEFKGDLNSFFMERNGNFCLYYGDLSKMENEYAARWLLEHVFNKLEIPFVVAGKNPSEGLEQAAHIRLHTCLVSNPSEVEMSELIKKAQVVLMPSFIEQQSQDSVLKSLLLGRHVLVNNKATNESPYAGWLEVAETPELFREKIELLFYKPFQESEKMKRLEGIQQMESDETKAMQLIRLMN